RRDRHVGEGVVFAPVRDRLIGGPQPTDHLHPFLEDRLVVLEGDVERQVFAAVVTTPGGENHAPPPGGGEGRPLLRPPKWVGGGGARSPPAPVARGGSGPRGRRARRRDRTALRAS